MPEEPPVTQRHGIEGKWVALQEERDEAREERDKLKADLAETEERLAQYTNSEVSDLMSRLTAAAVEIRTLKEGNGETILRLSDDEQEAMDGLMTAFNIIGNRWKLRSNQHELTSAVHVIQGFIQQHMLHRVAPKKWGDWWAPKEGA
jgi:predicted nuclease with TOPRIM domain